MSNFRFSVFTATYNRANFLPRVYKCLLDQTFKNFEWIVVDDGSTDNTEELINTYINEGKLKSIVYVKKDNGGKHTAWRVATDLFTANYVVGLDSDDTLLPNALEIYDKFWTELETLEVYDEFWEVKARVVDEQGKMVGSPLPLKIFDCSTIELTYKFKISGEMHACRKTTVLKEEAKVPDSFLYDKYCSNLPESIRWSRAGKKYKSRFIEEVVRVYYSDAPNRFMDKNKENKKRNIKGTYNNLVGAIYTIDELKTEMHKWDIISYLKNIVVLIYMCFALKLNPFKVIIKKEFDVIILISIFYIPVYMLYMIKG